jgi:hypothetical protein
VQVFACGYALALVVAGIIAASRSSDSEGVAVVGQTETAAPTDRPRSTVGPVGPTTTTTTTTTATTMVSSTTTAAPASTATTIAEAVAPTATPSTVPTRLPPSDGGATIEQGAGITFPPPPPVVEYVPPVRVPLATAVGPPTTTCVPTGDPYPTTTYVASMTMAWSDGHIENVTQVLTAAGRYDLRGDRGNVGSFQLRQLLPGFACDVLHGVWLQAWWG